ncbi:MAG: rod-binding protein [Rhodobacteraceae bacterium]|nr:rod-binding protein [Paracoccaceae bacterium]
MPPAPTAREPQLRQVFEEFEAVFLSQMLQAAGAGKPLSGLGGGGVGEAQFASMLVDVQARAIAARGGLGLAEMLLRASLQDGAGHDDS